MKNERIDDILNRIAELAACSNSGTLFRDMDTLSVAVSKLERLSNLRQATEAVIALYAGSPDLHAATLEMVEVKNRASVQYHLAVMDIATKDVPLIPDFALAIGEGEALSGTFPNGAGGTVAIDCAHPIFVDSPERFFDVLKPKEGFNGLVRFASTTREQLESCRAYFAHDYALEGCPEAVDWLAERVFPDAWREVSEFFELPSSQTDQRRDRQRAR